MTASTPRRHPLQDLLDRRIAIIDGAMGTTIRTYGMTEADIRGERFTDSRKDLLNNGDLFSLTQPTMICDIHRRFLEAGADIIETNTFGATSITQSEFFVDDPREHGGRKDPDFYQKIIEDQVPARPGLGDQRAVGAPVPGVGRPRGQRRRAPALRGGRDRPAHRVALQLARRRRRRLPRRDLRPGQAQRTSSRSGPSSPAGSTCCSSRPSSTRSTPRPRWSPSGRSSTRTARSLPVMISAAVGRGGETMISAQTVEAFWNAVKHVNPLSVGLNCSLGPDLMYPFLAELSQKLERGHLLLPERRAAQPAVADRLRSGAARHGPLPGRVRRGRPGQHRRRLLRQHARAHRGHRPGAGRQAAPPDPGAGSARPAGNGGPAKPAPAAADAEAAPDPAAPAPVGLAALHPAGRAST